MVGFDPGRRLPRQVSRLCGSFRGRIKEPQRPADERAVTPEPQPLLDTVSASGQGAGGAEAAHVEGARFLGGAIQPAVLGLAGRLLAGQDLQAIADAIVALAREALQTEHAGVYELDPRGEALVLRAASGGEPADAYASAAIRSAGPVVIEDFDRRPACAAASAATRPGSGVAVRIDGVGERPFGVLAVHWGAPRAIAHDEVTFVRSLAFVLAAAAQREHAQEEIDRRSRLDSLTGLPGRELFRDQLRQALALGAPAGGLAVVVLGLDRFKLVNETLGHHAGDELLCAVADRLGRSLEDGHTLARLAGDQFAILAEELTDERGALALARRLTERLEQPIMVGDRELFATATVGIAVAHDDVEPPDVVVRDAEIAMYRGKARGGARVEIFERDPQPRGPDPLLIEADLRRALRRRELRLVYQPLVSLDREEIVGFEALLRWAHPELGLVSPAQFVPVAESTGLIVPIGAWVVEQACHQLATWASRVESGTIPYVSVNVSGRQLTEPGFPGVVQRALAASGVPSDRLTLEITETLLMEQTVSPVAALQELKELGVRLMLDDFGTGYSSLSYIKQLPLDGLKLDRSFIVGLEHDEQDRRIVEAVVGMATALGLEVVAEGVETAAQLALLAGIGCDLAQGFYFARPMAGPALDELLSSGRRQALSAPVPTARDAGAAPETETITLGEAASALGVSASTLRRWTEQGRIRAARTPGGHRRFPLAEVRRVNALRGGTTRAAVRPLALPADPAPGASRLLEASGTMLVDTAARALYRQGHVGWFGSDEGREHLGRWTLAIASAFRRGHYETAAEASASLTRRAALSGASLLERHGFLEWFAEAMVRMLGSNGTSHAEISTARRLFTSIRQGLLAGAE